MTDEQWAAVSAAAKTAYQDAVADRKFSNVHERVALASVEAYKAVQPPLTCDERCVTAELVAALFPDLS